MYTYTVEDIRKVAGSGTLITVEQLRTLIPDADGNGPQTGARVYGIDAASGQIVSYRTTRDLDRFPPYTTDDITALWVADPSATVYSTIRKA